MDMAQSDLVEWYKLETEFFQDHFRHTRYVKEKNTHKKVKEDWSNCGELGTGGFSVVYKQVLGTTGRYRAVKTIDKKRLPPKLDYYRELLIMAILAKHPLLFVEFLGWYENPETLYIAMEYLPEGDLTKHIGSPLPQATVQTISKQILEGLKVMHQKGIAHRDLKPANIFVVLTSPFRVKLGDFGISKRIRPQDTTTFHTQVSTQIYGAPEVLGLDSNSKISAYTNAVDIWSLGCVIYESLVGTHLFTSWGQVSRYYHGKSPFPEDKLKGLPTPLDDVGISLLKSMLAIQPGDRPTAAGALGNAWLTGLESDDEDSGNDQDETAQSEDESNWSKGSEGKLTTHHRRKKRRGQRSPITQEDTTHAPGGSALGANPRSQWGSDPTAPESEIDTAMVISPDVAPLKSFIIQRQSINPRLRVDTSQFPGRPSHGPQGAEEKPGSQYPPSMPPK
ncbi:kinase-like domain-containing protein [Tuber borchii]|uniref:Kinase-like domain-containing protein n=1 Tax=Tuber borchii TaxID=42251 RepID=A0A2T6ZL36_TUBBO|nr:kinase-like domain-containing protein [Tuber borchii]